MLVAWGICSSTTYLKPTKKPPVCQDVCCAKPTDRPRLPVCGGGPFLISTRIPFAESRLWNGHDGGAKFTSELFSHIPQHSSRWISRLSSNYLQSKTATQTRNVKMPVAVPTNSSARPESGRLRIGVIGLGRMGQRHARNVGGRCSEHWAARSAQRTCADCTTGCIRRAASRACCSLRSSCRERCLG
jgi:hypothetical protein